MSLMAAAVGLPSDLAVHCLLSSQTFFVTVAFPRTESKPADPAVVVPFADTPSDRFSMSQGGVLACQTTNPTIRSTRRIPTRRTSQTSRPGRQIRPVRRTTGPLHEALVGDA